MRDMPQPSMTPVMGPPFRPQPTHEAAAFHDAMRKLWEDHVTWTRLAIVSFAGDLPDLPATQRRLLRNQTDIGTRSSRSTASRPATA